jgi:hypothetical protein
MSVHTRPNGVELSLSDGITVNEVPAAPSAGVDGEPRRGGGARGGGRRRLPVGPIPLIAPDGTASEPASDPVVEAMAAQDMVLLDAVELDVAAPGARTRAAGEPARAEVMVEVGDADDAVVLVEHDGVYSWHFANRQRTSVQPAARRGAVVVPPQRRLVFELDFAAAAAERRSRGPIGDFVRGRIRTYVLKFVARVAVGELMKFLERKARVGLVDMTSADATQWQPLEDLRSARLPTDRPARILLFVHGTFSSTLGSYGALSASAWGRAFLELARGRYDLVVGYDHRTLSEDPLENATDLLARLESGSFAHPPVVDAVAFSRGALVLRSLIEYLLPGSSLQARVRRAVFVGGTNGGTQLAQPDNWERLVDLYTNLAVAGCRAVGLIAPGAQVPALVLRESIQTVGALVKYMAAAAVRDQRVPGLAAMSPAGDFVARLNTAQPGQPGILDSYYCVVTSEFDIDAVRAGGGASELPRRLAEWIVDGLADNLMGEANDLVVNTASMCAIDPETGAFVKDRLDFGRNPHVYHTLYFTRPEVAKALTRWLGLDPRAASEGGARARPGGADGVPAGADDDLIVVRADDRFADVIETVRRELPSHVVVDRVEGGQEHFYAFRGEELLGLAERLTGDDPELTLFDALRIDRTLELHEYRESIRAPIDRPLPVLAPTLAPEVPNRAIVFDGDVPRAVVEPPAALPSSSGLGEAARRLRTAATPGAPTAPARRTRGARPRQGLAAAPPPPLGIEGRRMMPAAGAPADDAPLGAAPAGAAPEQDSCYVGAWMPGAIELQRVASVHVTLSRDVIEIAAGDTAATAPVQLDLSRTIIVQVIGTRNIDVVGDERAELDFSGGERRFELLFDVRGVREGEGEVRVVVRQGPTPLGTLYLRPRVSAAAVSQPVRVSATAEISTEPQPAGNFPVLQIFQRDKGATPIYHFVLDRGDGSYISRDSAPLRVGQAQYVEDVYREIEDRWLSHDDDVEAFNEDLRALGGQMFDELIPADVQASLWAMRDRLRAIHVLSEEPFVPWELVHLKPPREVGSVPAPLPPETHFLAQKGLVRWLHNYPAAARGVRIRPERSFHVVPEYAAAQWRLPEAQAEIPFLEERLHARPLEAADRTIMRLLSRGGAVDLFHFAGHGEADVDTSADARIMLLGRVEGGSYVPLYLRATRVQQSANLRSADGNQPMVVLNACQIGRAGWRLTSIGGFAEAFIRSGAGIFVGSLWAVGDAPARTFTEALYEALLDGRTLSEAASLGRDAARGAGEATWLAYVVYGHPLATLQVEAAAEPSATPAAAGGDRAGV